MSLHHGLRATSFGADDPHFRNTVLLLRGDGTNGAQNNTFLDGSTNNFTVTRNGNATQGSFNPYWPDGRWSNYFDGTGDYLTIADNSAFGFGTGDFTVEGWFFAWNPTSGNKIAIDTRTSYSSGQAWAFGFKDSLTPYYYDGSDKYSTSSMIKNTWNHVAWVRSGGLVYMYLNGSSIFTATSSSVGLSTAQFRIGADSNGSFSQPLSVSNLRVLKGSAQYTSAFTPSAVPLTAITNTSLLTCQSNRFRDNSSNAFTITRNGDAAVSAFNSFAPVEECSASSYGGSGYFDGNNDYINAPGGTAFDLGTTAEKDFTIEGWLWADGTQISYAGIAGRGASGAARYLVCFASGGTTLAVYCDGLTPNLVASSATITSDKAWHYFAFVRSGDVFKVYVDGVAGTTTNTITTGISTSTEVFRVGVDPQSSSRSFKGYLSNLRVTKSAVYTDNFTPPTTPLTAITNTQLLLNFTNGGIVDLTHCNNLETVGNAQVSTSVRKFGTGSLAFDGTGDWMLVAHRAEQFFRSGNFTILCWFYLGATGSARGIIGKGTSTTGWLLSTNTSDQVVFTYTSSTITSTGALSASTWYHLAVVREGTGTNQTKIYISGVNDGTGTVSTDFSQANNMYIGADRTGGSALNGNIDDLQVTAGVARYTGNFTPPTRQLAAR